MPHFIIIAGPSGSGKTFYAERLSAYLGQYHPTLSVMLMSMDHYYQPRPAHINTDEAIQRYKSETNFDTPDMIDFDLFHSHLKLLSEKKSIKRPIYDFHASDRLDKTVEVEPTDIIIVEGIFAHYNLSKSALNKKDYSAIFIESSAYLTYQRRRYVRDPIERGNSEALVKQKELRHIRNAFFSIIRPAAQSHSELFIINDHMFTDQATSDDEGESKEPHGLHEIVSLLQAKTKHQIKWPDASKPKL